VAHEIHQQSSDRPLYPVRVLADGGLDEPDEIIRFGGYPFVRTSAGGWSIADPAAAPAADDD